jgi:branched-subunit amino acid aminotransferase/4-amino-4-deoxychorismate lyase
MANRQIVNGEVVEGDRIEFTVTNPSFAFGYGLFETIKFTRGRPCFFDEHYDRLEGAAREVGLSLGFDRQEMRGQAMRLFEVNGVTEGVFKISLTMEGAGTRITLFLRNIGFDATNGPIRLCQSKAIKSSRAFTTVAKTLNYMDNWLELQRAQSKGFEQCLFSNERGEITECATANIFFVKDGALKTPALKCGLLEGVIRGQILRIAAEEGWLVDEGVYGVEEFSSADEAFATSSGKGIVAVSEFLGDRLVTFPTVESERVRHLISRLAIRELESLSIS